MRSIELINSGQAEDYGDIRDDDGNGDDTSTLIILSFVTCYSV